MAVTSVTPVVLEGFNIFNLDALTFTQATSASDGFTIDVSGYADHNILMLFQNTNSGSTARTVTIKAGNGLQGTTDLASGNIAAGEVGAVVVESGHFLNVSGDNKGLIKAIPSNAELKMACIILP